MWRRVREEEEVARICRDHLPRALALPPATREHILTELEAGWFDNQGHGNRRAWGRAASGFAHYLLRLRRPGEVATRFRVISLMADR